MKLEVGVLGDIFENLRASLDWIHSLVKSVTSTFMLVKPVSKGDG